ncbi:MAG: cobalt-precorrin-6A reductase [Cyanobacteria bacterium P01_D01_bin.123]
MPRFIWLVGGTSESIAIASYLSAYGLNWLATVTTPRAAKQYAEWPGRAEVVVLTESTAIDWAQNHSLSAIVDASHPFATHISQVAIATARTLDIPYLRYERPRILLAPETILLPDFPVLLQEHHLDKRRVLLTTGVKSLTLFRNWHQRSQLWVRILPTERSRTAAIAAGFPPERLIAQQLPIERASEQELWRSLAIDTVVTKAAGVEGGLDVKQEVARDLGVKLIAIDRPAMTYPRQTSHVEGVLAFCQTVAN